MSCMLILFIDLAQAGRSSADASASFSTNFNKADNVEFWFSQIQKCPFVTFFMQNFIEYECAVNIIPCESPAASTRDQ